MEDNPPYPESIFHPARSGGDGFSTFGVPRRIFALRMEKTLKEVSEAILASYDAVGGLNNTDGLNLPSKLAIASICEDLLQLLFPGFHDEEPVHRKFLPRQTQHRLNTLSERIEEQICKSLRIGDPECPAARAREILVRFLQGLPAIRELLRTDIDAAFEGDPAAQSTEEIILSYPFLEAIAIQRAAHRLYGEKVPLIPRMMTEWAHARTGIDIHPGAKIGPYFFIDHGTGVVVGETSEIGEHVKLYQGVALIARSLAGGQALRGVKRHPTLEARVTIYAGTTVMGGDTVIGSGSTVGANVFVTHSIPPRSLVFYEEAQLKVVPKRAREEAELAWDI
jgi:serine O-acetyltransferase